MSPASERYRSRSVEFLISPQIKFKKKWLDNKGVSEIIGTILMLSITVVLFSSIMVFVTNMPTPTAKPTVDFLSHLHVSTDASHKSYLNLTHNGGEPLNDYETTILLVIDDSPKTFSPTGYFSDGKWSIGRTWVFDAFHDYPNFGLNTTLEAMIIDTKSNSQVWNSRISAGAGSDAPVILQRWADGDTSTLTIDPIVPSDTHGFRINVRITDIDGLSSTLPTSGGALYTGPRGGTPPEGVWLDASSIPLSSTISRTAYSGGIWSFDFPKFTNVSTYDGKPLFIHATDHSGLETIQSIMLSVSQPNINYDVSQTNITYNGTEPTSESGLPSYLKWFDADQGYVVLGANVNSGSPPRSPNLTDPRSTFSQGEYVFIRVGSFKLQNIFAKNNLTIINRLSGTSTNPTGNSTPFYRVPSGGVFIYEAKFSTASLLGGYDMRIGLQSTVTSGINLISFNAVANLIVQPSSGPPLVLPEVRLNATDPLYRSALQLGTYENPFDLSDASKSIIWVDLKFLDAGAGQTLNVGKVEIKDLRDRTVLSGVPPLTAASNSTFGKVYSNLTKDYAFKIDLRLRNGYNLVPGTATYTLTISNAFDGNEGVYTMSVPIWIKSATNTKNYIVATSGFGGSGNFNDISFLFQIENNKFFTTRVLDKVAQSPSAPDLETYRVIYLDVDGDGDRDVVASMKTPAGFGLGIFINRMNEFGIWEPKSFYPDPDASKITALAYGDVNNDGAPDFVTANLLGKVYLYNNTFPVTNAALLKAPAVANIPEIFGVKVLEMRLADMTGDGKADLVVLVDADERKNTVKGQIYIYDLSTGRAVKLTTVNVDDMVFDFDVADINNDGYQDYATSSSARGVGWYRAVPTTNSYSAVLDIADTTAPYTNVTNTYTNTITPTPVSGDETIQENGATAEHIWKMNSPLVGSSPRLRIDAKVNTGCTEAFYFYYSTNSAGPWTFMFYVPSSASGSYQSFYQNLRSDISGTVYIRVTDSTPGDGSMNSINIDLIQITTIGGMNFNSDYHTLQSNGTSMTFPAIGIGNFNGDATLDVAVGKVGDIWIVNGAINGAGGIIRADGTADIRAAGDTFVVNDVNGDNLADLVYVLMYMETAVVDTYSIVTEWINTVGGTVGSTMQVKHLVQSYGPSATGKTNNYGPQIYGAINCIAVENPYG